MPNPKSTLVSQIQAYSGVAGVLTILGAVTISMALAGLRLIDTRPISYLGTNPKSSLLFSAGLIVSAIMFITFGLYLRATLKLTSRFFSYLLIGQVGQIIAALVPYSGPLKPVHTAAAFTLAFSLPLLIKQFTTTQSGSPSHQIYKTLLRLEQAAFVVGIVIFVFTRGIAPIGEALPAIGFHIWIITVTAILMRDQVQAEVG